MKISREQVAENRKRILDAAARMVRERGFDGVTVAEIMNDAGLTHGAFYGHFGSKDELIAQAFEHVLTLQADREAKAKAPPTIAEHAAEYLSTLHRDDIGTGCLFSALGPEAARSSPAARHTLTAAIEKRIDELSLSAPGATKAERRRAAIGSWSAMIGAVVLARISDDPALSDELLAQTKRWLKQ